MSAYIIIK